MKQSWPPCADCGQPDGPITGHRRTPDRWSGAPYGIAGELCHICAMRRQYWHKKGQPVPERRRANRGQQLAAAVLALDAAMQGDDVQEQGRQYAAAVALARTVGRERMVTT